MLLRYLIAKIIRMPKICKGSVYSLPIKSELSILLFQAYAPLGAIGEIGRQAAVGDCEVKAPSSKAGYLVGLEREKHTIWSQGGHG